MVAPFRAPTLQKLLDQINAAYPKRNKASDGWIGDTAHSRRKSDHNPDTDGTVDGIDITHDPETFDASRFVAAMIREKPKQIAYMIFNGKIIAGNRGLQPWVPRPYKGANKHTKHVHISILDEYQDLKTPWPIDETKPLTAAEMKLELGAEGPAVIQLQKDLVALGYGPLSSDGRFKEKTKKAVESFQVDHGLSMDGRVGPRTQKAIGEALKAKQVKPKVEAAKEAADKTVKEKATDALAVVTTVGVAGQTVKTTVDAVNEGTASLVGLGPWVLLGGVVTAVAVYVFMQERSKKAAARALSAKLEDDGE